MPTATITHMKTSYFYGRGGAYQHELANREERLENMRDALINLTSGRGALPGRLCVVFDDILTTGASLQAAADVMLAGGCTRAAARPRGSGPYGPAF